MLRCDYVSVEEPSMWNFVYVLEGRNVNDQIGRARLTATMPPPIDVHRMQVRNRPSMSHVPPGVDVVLETAHVKY